LFLQIRKFDRALPLLEEAVAGYTAALGEDNPNTFLARKQLAWAYMTASKPALAVPHFEQILARPEGMADFGDQETFNARYGLAVAHFNAGKPERALPMFEQLFVRYKDDSPFGEVWTFNTMYFLARSHVALKRPEKGVPLYEEALTRLKEKLKADDSILHTAVDLVAKGLLDAKQFPKAEKHLRESLVVRERNQSDAWTTFNAKSLLGGALLGRQKYADAEPLLRASYEGLKRHADKIPPEGKVCLTEALERLVQLYDARGNADEAARWRKELEAQIKAAGKTADPDDE
jgi:tetratricopeptide (TPR) repeat protein